ncbi:elongation of very long chain fatty acids protein 7-like [Panonychus citri]|uniref:elongation of very long chain fatty acids protein 7-like n=1 Tax=Panonychus citri TaxID=50023 RepID=UPI0023075B4E|nr:elongation of very long chain fatty acids protein 7-like [Panonychus citri]
MVIQRASETLNYYVHDFWDHQGDPRIADYPFFNSGPWLTLTLVGLYLLIVKYFGPMWMRDRKPYDLRRVLIGYNAAMVVLSGYIYYRGSIILSFGLDAWGCTRYPYDPTDFSDKALESLSLGWLFFVSKLIEFADTFFFVLRKKNSHISDLHVFHHSTVPISVWIGMKFYTGVNNAFFPLLNSGVHTFMYTYYGLAAFVSGANGSLSYPRITKLLRTTKKYLTTLQIGQFILAILHGLYSLALPDCDFPKSSIVVNLGNAFIFLGLFYSYYRKSYTRKID